MSRSLALAALAWVLPACSSDTCTTIAADVGEFCLQRTMAADRQLVIEVREQCGKGCSSTPSCDAFLRNGEVFLDVKQDLCSATAYAQCIQIGCVQRVIRCSLPALHEGDYALVAPGAGVQLLRVRADGQASCLFPPPTDGGV